MNAGKCTLCPAGSFCQRSVKSSCGSNSTSAPGASFCTSCPPSMFAAEAHTTCLLVKTRCCANLTYNNQCLDKCPAASFIQSLSGSDHCLDCTLCQPNQFENRSCSLQADRQCSSCTVCNNSDYQVSPCTSTTDRSCASCHSECATCTGPGNKQCSSCNSTLFLDLSKQSCDRSCLRGYVSKICLQLLEG
jgi:proprotein convertase subtilisin/kexin type 5